MENVSTDFSTIKPASFFDGNAFQLIGYRILSFLISALTLGIAYPWMLCMVQRWETKHTVIHGRRLKFTGQGHQLIGKYLLWLLLTIITLGIYSIWFGLGMKRWVVKHTVYADEVQPIESHFSGGAGGYFGIHILAFLLTFLTLGISKAWADKMVLSWETGHTHIGGNTLVFNGTGGQLFVKYLLFILLTPLTLGIYMLFFPVSYLKWEVKHTDAIAPGTALPSQNNSLLVVLGVLLGILMLALVGLLSAIFLLDGRSDSRPAELVVSEKEYFTAPVTVVSVDEVRGKSYQIKDSFDRDIEYVFADEAFYDSEQNTLYIHFGLIHSEYSVYLQFTDGNQWRTQAVIAGEGITMIPVLEMPPSNPCSLELRIEGFSASLEDGAESYQEPRTLLNRHHLDVIYGNSEEAEEWLLQLQGIVDVEDQVTEDEIVEDETSEEISEQEIIEEEIDDTEVLLTADELIGFWVCTETTVNTYTGENLLFVNDWTFHADGTCDFGSTEYYEGTGDFAEYIDGKYWIACGGGGRSGTYTLDGNMLTVITTPSVQDPESYTFVYTIEIDENTMVMNDLNHGITKIYYR